MYEDLIKKYNEIKPKKVYSVSLTEDKVEFIKKEIKIPFSKILDDMLDELIKVVKLGSDE